MNILQFAGVPKGTSVVEDRNPQGKTPEQLHAILEAEEADKATYNQYMEDWKREHDATLGNHFFRTWREESMAKALWNKAEDLGTEWDDSYDPEQDMSKVPEDWPPAYKDAMKQARNATHFQTLLQRYQHQIDYNTESEYLGGKGTAVALAAMVLNPETALMGAGEAAVLSKLAAKTAGKRFVAGALVGGLSNTAQELAIITNNKSRDKISAAIAFGTGAALGGGLSAFMRPGSSLDETIKAKKAIAKDYSRGVETDLDVSVNRRLYEGTSDTSAMYRGQLEGRIARDPATGKYYVDVDGQAVEALDKSDAIKRYRTLEDSGFYKRKPAETGTPAEGVADVVADEIPEPKMSLDDADQIDADIPRQKAYTGLLKSIGSEGMASKNPFERLLTWLTVEFAPGTGGRKVASQSAALEADMLATSLRSKFHPHRLEAIRGWKKDMGIRSMPWDESVTNRFDREVFKELHYRRYPKTRPAGEGVNLHVGRMANVYEDIEIRKFKLQQDSGVHGYQGLEPDSLHTSNRWDPTRLSRIERSKGKDFVIKLIKKGILESKEFERTHKYAKLGDKLTNAFKEQRAHYMAKAVYERFTRRPDTVNLARSSYIRVQDRKLLESRLAEAINDPNTLTHIMTSVDGKDSRLLHEYMKQIEVNLNTELDGLSVADLMDLDLGRKVDSEFRRAAGKAAMAKKGFRDESSWMETAELVGQWYRKNTDLDQRAIEEHVTKMQKLWKVVQGDSLEADPSGKTARFLRGMRRAATLGSMNQVGFAQFAEMGRVLGSLGVKTFMEQIPAMKAMRRAMMNGEFKDPILRDIEAAFDVRLGDNHLLHHPLIMADSGGYGIATEGSNAFLKGLDTLSMKGLHVQGYINGMNQITRLQQRMHARGFFMRMYDDVLKGNRIKRYHDLGLSDADLKAIGQEFKTKSTTTKGWFGQDRLHKLNLQSFNPEMSEKLALAFHKAQAQAVQRNLGGETAWLMESSFGKLMTQFRTFPIVALEKQTIHDLKFLDIESFTTLLASFGFASLAYMAKTYANSFGMPKQKRKSYLKNRIGTPGRIAGGAYGWMGQAAITPEIFDSVLTATNLDNPFRYTDYKGARFRQYSDGMSIDRLGPGASYLNNAYRFATGMHAAFMNDEELADHTLKRGVRLIPFNNALGLTNAANSLIGD